MIPKTIGFILIFIGLGLPVSSSAEAIPYYDPYTDTFTEIEAKQVYHSESLLLFEDAANRRPLTQDFYHDLSRKIEAGFIKDYAFLFSLAEKEIPLPIRFIFSEKLSRPNDLPYFYQAYYAAKYKKNYGYEAILLNPGNIPKEEFYFYVAHELFHLFYRLKEDQPVRWIDEGLAQFFAAILTDFMPQYQITKYFENPTVSLEAFPDGRPEYYGHAFLFFHYLTLHHLSPKDLKRLIQASHPKALFEEGQWRAILREFSLAKLLNTIYFDEKRRYSLKPVYGKITPAASFPQEITPQKYLSIYVTGSDENRAAALAFHEKLKEAGWQTEIITVLTPKFGIPKIVDALNDSDTGHPYMLVLNIYGRHEQAGK